MADRDGNGNRDRSVPSPEGAAAFAIPAGGSMLRGAMPATSQGATATANSNAPSPQVTPHLEFLYRVAERFGVPVVILAIVLWWVRNDLVQPLMDAHFQFLDKITEAHEKQVGELSGISSKLDTLIRVQDGK